MNGGLNREGFRPAPFPHWRQQRSRVSTCFTGRLGDARFPKRAEVLEQINGAPEELAWLEQRHSAIVQSASAGGCGEGDALWTCQPDLALALVTADCVPILVGSDQVVAAIHAGWRGLVAGVIEATLAELPGQPGVLDAWLGPAIGPCCYEVGEDVADLVSNASEPAIVTSSRTKRPHIDLHRASEWQLRQHGVERVHRITPCTRCNPELLWSYRGSSGTNGRNLTFAWLSS